MRGRLGLDGNGGCCFWGSLVLGGGSGSRRRRPFFDVGSCFRAGLFVVGRRLALASRLARPRFGSLQGNPGAFGVVFKAKLFQGGHLPVQDGAGHQTVSDPNRVGAVVVQQ